MDIQQISDLAAAYLSAGLGESWAGGFLLSVSESGEMPKGRGLTIAADLLEKGDPKTWPNWDLAISALDAASKSSSKDDAETLRSIANRVREGKLISDKQVNLVNRLINFAHVPKKMRDLNEFDFGWLDGVRQKVSMSSQWYWAHRPGTHGRLIKLLSAVEVLQLQNGEGNFQKQLSEESWEFATKHYASLWKEWNDAHSATGELKTHEGVICLVAGGQCMIDGQVCVSVMKDGVATYVQFNQLKAITRAPRRKKTSV